MILWIAALVLALDLVTKSIALKNLADGRSIKILPGIFHLTLVLNRGAAFGLFKDQNLIFVTLSLVVILFIIIYTYKRKIRDAAALTGLGLILGGALGNIIDRLRFGYVIDFLDFRIWPVFNVADSCITVGAAILAFRIIFGNLHASNYIRHRDI